jgi:hypothetical protein
MDKKDYFFVSDRRLCICKYSFFGKPAVREIPIESMEDAVITEHTTEMSGASDRRDTFTAPRTKLTTYWITIKLKHTNKPVPVYAQNLKPILAALQVGINARNNGLNAVDEFQRLKEAASEKFDS